MSSRNLEPWQCKTNHSLPHKSQSPDCPLHTHKPPSDVFQSHRRTMTLPTSRVQQTMSTTSLRKLALSVPNALKIETLQISSLQPSSPSIPLTHALPPRFPS